MHAGCEHSAAARENASLLRPLSERCRHFIALSDLIDRQAVERRAHPPLALHHASENTSTGSSNPFRGDGPLVETRTTAPADAVTASRALP